MVHRWEMKSVPYTNETVFNNVCYNHTSMAIRGKRLVKIFDRLNLNCAIQEKLGRVFLRIRQITSNKN